jgi:hypothetical protein
MEVKNVHFVLQNLLFKGMTGDLSGVSKRQRKQIAVP